MVERNHRAFDAYVTDTVYPSSYLRQLQPALLSYVAATSGYAPPRPNEPFTYLELGCGTGATLNVLAASNPESRFIGVDFNPAHIAFAEDDARKGNVGNVEYIGKGFQDIQPDDLPECDYVAIQGTYSWLQDTAQNSVLEIVGSKLRTGGLFFIDFLCAPRAAPVDPMWVLLREITRSSDGTSEQRVAEGMDILKQLGSLELGYLANTPPAKAALARNLRLVDDGQPSSLSHLAHRALAEFQTPSYFFEVEEALSQYGLKFAGSTSTLRNEPELCLPPELLDLYFKQDDLSVRELIKDFALNESPRKDVFVKTETFDEEAARDYLRDQVFIFGMQPAAAILRNWNREFQNWNTRHKPEPAAELILELVNKGQFSFGEFERAGLEQGIEFEQIVRALNILIARPEISLCRKAPQVGGSTVQMAMPTSNMFNRGVSGRPDVPENSRMVLASPVLGAGLVLGQGPSAMLDPARSKEDAAAPDDHPDTPAGDKDVQDNRRKREAALLSKLAQLEVTA